ncbi:MAG: response regulator transcription factor, partial [Silicimonas sp.]|nr:response regulator transcription factor [Silicimonas sp.]
MRLLIADDHDMVRDTIAMFLESEGVTEIGTAATLGEAIDKVRESGAYDLVLLDYNMPGMNGLTGLAQMKQANDDRPVAILSGSASPNVARDAIDQGAAGFLPKTLGARSMVSAIRFMAAGETFVPLDFMQESDKKTVGNLT